MALGGMTKLSWGVCLLAGAAAVSATTGYAADLSLKDTPSLVLDTGSKLDWTANFGATSDYVFRGISQNGREPAVQGGLDATYGMFYVGTWMSMVNFDAPETPSINKINANEEWDVYGGIKPKWGDYTFDLGVIGYLYPGVHVQHPYTYEQDLRRAQGGDQ